LIFVSERANKKEAGMTGPPGFLLLLRMSAISFYGTSRTLIFRWRCFYTASLPLYLPRTVLLLPSAQTLPLKHT
jgi:hypothetical protein